LTAIKITVKLGLVERNQLIKYRFAALLGLPERMLAVHIFMAFPAFPTCSPRFRCTSDGTVRGGALFLCASLQYKNRLKEIAGLFLGETASGA